MPKAKVITGKQREGLLKTLKARFEAHMRRHAGLEWTAVKARVESNSAKLRSLSEMEQSGGEPDVVGIDETTGECIFMDCSAAESQGAPERLLRSRSARGTEGAQAEEQRC
jgi:Protein of unknown function (DUF4256)